MLGPLAVALATGYGLTPDDWQADVVDCALARRAGGRYAAATVGQAVPRQNGKNGWLEVRELFGMIAIGEKFLHTAHEVKTARKAFRRIASFFENERQYPELAALVVEIRKTNGQEAIVLANGGSIEFIARSSGSGRGFTVDVLVCDEAQDLTDDELAALLPTISAAPLGNPQVILTGTPPDPEKPESAKGEVFRRVRKDAQQNADSNLCFIDFGVPDGPLPNVDDRALWYQVNPALGGRLNVAEVERERKLMSPEKFARERLGWWGDGAVGSGALPYGAWLNLADPAVERGSDVVFGADVAEDRAGWVAVAWTRPDGSCQLSLTNKGEAFPAYELVGESDRLTREWGGRVVPPRAFEAEMAEAAVPLLPMKAGEFSSACGAFLDAINEGTVHHGNQPALNAAVRSAKWRSAGATGERAFQLKDMPEIGPLAAAVRAHHGWRMSQGNNYDVLDSIG